MGGDRPVKDSPRGVVTLMSTSRPNDVRELKKALGKLSSNFLQQFPYPVRLLCRNAVLCMLDKALRGGENTNNALRERSNIL